LGIYLNKENAHLVEDLYSGYRSLKGLSFYLEEKDLSDEQKFDLSMFFEKFQEKENTPYLSVFISENYLKNLGLVF